MAETTFSELQGVVNSHMVTEALELKITQGSFLKAAVAFHLKLKEVTDMLPDVGGEESLPALLRTQIEAMGKASEELAQAMVGAGNALTALSKGIAACAVSTGMLCVFSHAKPDSEAPVEGESTHTHTHRRRRRTRSSLGADKASSTGLAFFVSCADCLFA